MKEVLKEVVVRKANEVLMQAVPLTTQDTSMPWLIPANVLNELSEAMGKLRIAEGEDLEDLEEDEND